MEDILLALFKGFVSFKSQNLQFETLSGFLFYQKTWLENGKSLKRGINSNLG